MPYSKAKGIKIYYEVSGEGFPLVLIHATPFDHDLFTYQINHFSTYFKVIAVDLRGFGRSDKPVGEFSLKDMGDDILGILREERVKEAILLGVSVGSGIALLLGLDHAPMFKALILVGGNSGPGPRIPDLIHGYTEIGVERYRIQHMEDLVSPEFPKSKLGGYLFRLVLERNSWLSGKSIGQVFRARGGTDLTPRLGSLKIPTLVINGEYDNSLPAGKRTAGMVPGAIHRILPKTGHACCIEDPAGFDELVVDFLRSLGLMPPVER